MKTIDTHAHLDQVENVETAMKEAAAAGVEAVVAVGSDLASNQRNLELKRSIQNPRIYLGLGIHPGNIKTEEIEPTLKFIRENIREANAIGEIGLDFWYKWLRKDQEKHEEQRRVFLRQLELAKEFNLPVVVHSRGTWRECLETTKKVGIKKAVFHWYSGPVDVLQDIIKAGYLVSCSPSLAYSPQSREAISAAPIEHTLIETDCPVFYQSREEGERSSEGFTATPKHVFKTLTAYCELKHMKEEQAVEVFNSNAKQFFNIDF
jgi:TatD DNase family protein